ncbi:MAG: flagellar basal-body rod protein FlgF [Bradyrhizobium sp.]
MDNTVLVSLSRQSALRRELEIVANNIANLNTTGFKADGAVFSEFLRPGAASEGFSGADQRISFVQGSASWHDMSPGTIQQTGNPLDVAIDGNGMLVVQTPRGERYTRNGALQIGPTGELVTSNGDPVLGDAGPIKLQPSDKDIMIAKDGTIKVREGVAVTTDSTRGRLRLVSFSNPQQLQKDGTSMFKAPDGVAPEPAVKVNVVQGAIEKSNVRSVVEVTRMIEITRAYTEVAGILQQQSDLRRNSIQQLADVPA